MKLSWELFRRSNPYICSSCKAGLWEVRETCEMCGEKLTIRVMTKEDYKAEMKRRKND